MCLGIESPVPLYRFITVTVFSSNQACVRVCSLAGGDREATQCYLCSNHPFPLSGGMLTVIDNSSMFRGLLPQARTHFLITLPVRLIHPQYARQILDFNDPVSHLWLNKGCWYPAFFNKAANSCRIQSLKVVCDDLMSSGCKFSLSPASLFALLAALLLVLQTGSKLTPLVEPEFHQCLTLPFKWVQTSDSSHSHTNWRVIGDS